MSGLNCLKCECPAHSNNITWHNAHINVLPHYSPHGPIWGFTRRIDRISWPRGGEFDDGGEFDGIITACVVKSPLNPPFVYWVCVGN